MCDCNIGFSGKNCSINIDDCATNPCKNNGTNALILLMALYVIVAQDSLAIIAVLILMIV